MNRSHARAFVSDTFTHGFDKDRFRTFVQNLVNHFDADKAAHWSNTRVKDAFKDHVQHYERLGTYTSPSGEKVDVLIVHLTTNSKLERARTSIRNFVADHLKQRDEKDAALVAFVSPSESSWRFSYVRMEYATVQAESGKVGVEARLTPARRFSYIVGEGESCHTAQSRFLNLLGNDDIDPSLAQLEEAFSVEAVTKEFFEQYADLFIRINAELENLADKHKAIRDEFARKDIPTVDFAKKLMGQIVFLYFLQKKGWLAVERGKPWGTGPHDLLRRMANGSYGQYKNFFNDILEPLFYDTLATDRGHDAWCDLFKCRIPFLNGGLFEPLGDYDWRSIDIPLPNELFTNSKHIEEGVTGSGVLDVFDRYNFTVNEAEPLEQEVAIDPEMLGKVFENLIEENRRKGLGAFYTPREIVHYMCQQCLVHFLHSGLIDAGESVSREDVDTFVRLGEQISHYEAVDASYPVKMPKSIKTHARLMDEKLAAITVCDPAVGSGAFPVGMMTEIVRCRIALTPYFNDVHERNPYHFKRHAIQHSLYGVDIDTGAVEIAKLRLWLSLVVDEEETQQIKPLPNLDYKIVEGNSLLGVEKDLFNFHMFSELESLKPLYFNETDKREKARVKMQIDALIDQLTNGKKIFDFHIYFSEIFNNRRGFDVVIGNPPYITLALGRGRNLLDERKVKEYREKYPALAQYKGNTYSLFIGVSSLLLGKGSSLSYIVPNTLLLGNTMKKIRSFILDAFSIEELVNIRDRVFEEAEVGGNLVFRFSFCEAPNSHKCAVVDLRDLELLSTGKRAYVEQATFRSFSDLRFSVDMSHSHVMRKIASNAKPLSEVGYFYNGIKTGDNKRFLADKKLNRKYEEVIRGRDVHRYCIEYGKNFVLFDVEELWSNTNEIKLRKNPKIVIRQTGDSLIAALDTRGVVTLDTTHLLFDTALDIKAMLALLNSRLLNWYHSRLVEEVGRVFAEVKIVNLRKLPICLEAFDRKQESCLSSLVDRILAAKSRDLEANIAVFEEEIDRIVYNLYGLSPSEITLVQS